MTRYLAEELGLSLFDSVPFDHPFDVQVRDVATR
jgi:hypothetical protein